MSSRFRDALDDGTRGVRLGGGHLPALLICIACGNSAIESSDAGLDAQTDATDSWRDSGPPRSCRPPASECDLLAQDCPVGEACRLPSLAAQEGARCEPAGSLQLGASCDSSLGDGCAPGLFCFAGECARYCCDGESADCPPDHFCIGARGTVDRCRTGTACDVFDGTGCPDVDLSCYLAGPSTDCFETGVGSDGDSCTGGWNACAPGHACFREGDASVCRQLCRQELHGTDCPDSPARRCSILSGALPGVGGCIPR